MIAEAFVLWTLPQYGGDCMWPLLRRGAVAVVVVLVVGVLGVGVEGTGMNKCSSGWTVKRVISERVYEVWYSEIHWVLVDRGGLEV